MNSLLQASAESSPRSALAALLAGVVIVLIAACSGASALATPVATTHVDLPRSYRFAPEDISIQVGNTVTWTNNDSFTHSVKFDGSDEVQMMKPGESVSRDFPTAGLYSYICTLHPNDMHGTVLVKPVADGETKLN